MVVEWGGVKENGPASAVTFAAFDTETTGLSPVNDRVVEIAAARFRADGTPIDAFEQLVDPGLPIPPSLTEIHGIDDSMVAGKPRLEEVLPEFIRFVGDAVMVAHNAPYDIAMLMVPLVRMGNGVRRVRPPGNLVLDTCALARATFPGAPNYRLTTIAVRLGIAQERAHRAMPDVLTCREVFLRVLGSREPGITLADLVRLNGSELRFGPHGEALSRIEASSAAAAGRIRALKQAVETGDRVTIEYRGGTKGSGPRLITPITMLEQGAQTYLVAHCHVDGCLKNFRMDRILGVTEVPE